METTTTTNFGFYHIEWWDGRTGQQVLFDALRATGSIDGCHVYNPSALSVTGDDMGEMDLFFSIPTASDDTFMECVRAIREAGMRVKTAMYLGDRRDIATGSMDGLWAYFDSFLGDDDE